MLRRLLTISNSCSKSLVDLLNLRLIGTGRIGPYKTSHWRHTPPTSLLDQRRIKENHTTLTIVIMRDFVEDRRVEMRPWWGHKITSKAWIKSTSSPSLDFELPNFRYLLPKPDTKLTTRHRADSLNKLNHPHDMAPPAQDPSEKVSILAGPFPTAIGPEVGMAGEVPAALILAKCSAVRLLKQSSPDCAKLTPG